jgi:predicted ABC-type ATPase
MIWFIAGINGAGKSTISDTPELLEFMGVREVVNPDDVARRIEHRTGLEYRLANLCAAIQTQSWVFQRAIIAANPRIAIETVLSTAKYEPILDIAAQLEFGVGMIYVSVRSPELALKRIETRVAAGLHDVPEEIVRQRWRRTLENSCRWAPRVELIVFANNNADGRLVRVAQKRGKDSTIEVLNCDELPELVELLLNATRA